MIVFIIDKVSITVSQSPRCKLRCFCPEPIVRGPNILCLLSQRIGEARTYSNIRSWKQSIYIFSFKNDKNSP